MAFLIADTFTDSLARLTGDEQKAVKTTAFDLQLNPGNPGMKFHKLDRAKDKNFWSVRVNADIRLIVHKTADSLLLCYVDHHDKAYAWAERRKLQTHPKTGAAQLVEIRETVQEVVVPKVVEKPAAPKPFAAIPDEELLGYGVPPEWLADVRAADEDSILGVATHLPAEAADAVARHGHLMRAHVRRGRRAFLHAAVKHVHVAQELINERRGWMVVNLIRRARLLNATLIEHHHAVGYFQRFFLVVGDKHAGQIDFVVQAPEPAAQLFPHLGVQRPKRLIEQQHLRFNGECSRERDALTLATGELMWVAVRKPIELHEFQ